MYSLSSIYEGSHAFENDELSRDAYFIEDETVLLFEIPQHVLSEVISTGHVEVVALLKQV